MTFHKNKKKKLLGSVLFMGRDGCNYSNKLKVYLEKKSKKFYYFKSKKLGEKLPRKYLKLNLDYVFCFRSYCILKEKFLKKIKIAAINFHPGTPKYRGMGCINYAIYQNAKFYGSTAHLISKKIDYGKIININKFKLNSKDNLNTVLKKTHFLMFKQFIRVIDGICSNKDYLEKNINKNSNIKWHKKIKNNKDLKEFYQIDKKISKKNFERKIRSLLTKDYKPYIILHGKKFVYE